VGIELFRYLDIRFRMCKSFKNKKFHARPESPEWSKTLALVTCRSREICRHFPALFFRQFAFCAAEIFLLAAADILRVFFLRPPPNAAIAATTPSSLFASCACSFLSADRMFMRPPRASYHETQWARKRGSAESRGPKKERRRPSRDWRDNRRWYTPVSPKDLTLLPIRELNSRNSPPEEVQPCDTGH
jgi:hypothetical protein